MNRTEHPPSAASRLSRRWVFFTFVSVLALQPLEAQSKKKPERPEAPMISPQVEAERQRFLEGLKVAKPMPMAAPASDSAQHKDSTSSGGLAERDMVTGAINLKPRTTDPMLGEVSAAMQAQSQEGHIPQGHGDGIQGQNATNFEGKTPSGNTPIPKTQSVTPPGPLLYPYSYPWNTVYKLLVRFGSAYYVCSAASASSFHLISAGHCIYNASEGGWASEVWAWAAQTDVVDPRYVEDYPYGVAKVTWMVTYNAWINSADLNWDFSFLTLDRRMGDHTGWMGRETSCASSLNFDGYPIEYPYISYANSFYQFPGYDDGNVAYCNSNRIGLNAFIYGGHSGGPEWRFDGTNRWIEGVNSTSNRSGNAEGTRYTNSIHNDLNNQINSDRTVRPPVDRPDMIEYVFNTTSKGLLNTSATIGSSFGVKYNAFNAGFADSGSVYLNYYLTRSSSFSTYDYYVGSQTDPSLGAFYYEVNSKYLTVPTNVPPGTYYLGYTMGSAVAEASTDNNKVIITNQTLSVSCPADGYEIDNDSTRASVLTSTQYHAICPATDQDWAKFTVSQTSGITLSTDGVSGDTLLYLYDSSLNLVASDDDSGNGYFSLISRACASNPLSAGTYFVKVAGYGATNSIPSYSLSLSTSTCPAPALVSVSVPTPVLGGQTRTGRVNLAAAAGPGGVTVAVSDNSPATNVPSSVLVPAGATYVDFPVVVNAVATATTVTVSATLNGVTKTDTTVVQPPALKALTISPGQVNGGTPAVGTITLTGIAPAGGMTVAVADNKAFTAVPASVVVPAGSTSQTFTVVTGGVQLNVTSTVTATLAGISKSADILVKAPVPVSLKVLPVQVIGGTASTGTITISSPAPPAGFVITLSSSDTGAATTPATVTVPARTTTVDFPITSHPVLTLATVTITATRGTLSKAATLKVLAPSVVSLTLSPPSVRGGTSSTATATFSGPVPAGFVLTLTSSNTAAARVPATVAVSANATSRAFAVTTLPVTANTSSIIKAAYGASYKTATLTVTP